MSFCTFWVPICQNRPSIGREKSIFRFFACRGGCNFLSSILGVKISNRPNKVRVSKNRENHVFEYIVLEYVESSGEQPPTLRKMFRGHLGVENSILLNPDFGPKRNFEWKWKSTLQRLACISKLGFWEIFGCPRCEPKKKKIAPADFFFFWVTPRAFKILPKT